jgi:glycerate kinase
MLVVATHPTGGNFPARETARMRVLIAPDSFTGTLSAVQAAEAIAAGWRDTAPDDELVLAPLSDGGPGFVHVLHSCLGGELVAVTVSGPLGEPVSASLLRVGEVAYLESAQAAGLHLILPERRDPTLTTSYGVGELIAAAVAAGATRVVLGLGGSGTNDGGAGALAALGAAPAQLLRGGGAGLRGLDPAALDLTAARARLAGVELQLATDVDSVLLGLRGASATFGPQKGADADAVQRLDAALEHFARAAQPGVGLNMTGSVAIAPGAGAAGGLGFGLMLLGATRLAGIATVAELTGLTAAVGTVDLVITGEGSFDWQSLAGKVVAGVAAAAGEHARPCLVLAGRVEVGRREIAALGVSAAYAITDEVPAADALAHPDEHLRALAARVARNWSRSM